MVLQIYQGEFPSAIFTVINETGRGKMAFHNMAKNLYSVLGVARDASQSDIKRSYRKLAKDLHPDRNLDNDKVSDRFKEVSACYAILGDAKQRARYDRGEIDDSGTKRAPFAGAGARQAGGYANYEDIFARAAEQQRQGGASFDFSGGPEDFFSDIFGFGRSKKKSAKSAKAKKTRGRTNDVSYNLTISFLDAALGMTKNLTLRNGKTLSVKIPAGVNDGQQIRLSGQGQKGFAGSRAGDALIRVHVAPHLYFERVENNIFLELPITIDEAILGAKISVPTVRGAVSVKIPKGTSSGKRLRLKGKGIQHGAKSGDQYITLKITLPESHDPDLEAVIKEWRETHGYSVRKKFK